MAYNSAKAEPGNGSLGRDSIIVLDLSGRFTSVDEKFQVFCGRSSEELLYEPLWALVPVQRQGQVQAFLADVLQGRACSFDLELIHKSGQRVPMEFMLTPVVVNGQVVTMYGICRDFAEPNGLETVLAETRERLNQIYDRVCLAMWSVDVVNHQLLYTSPDASRVLGWSVEELYSQPGVWRQKIHAGDVPSVEHALSKALLGKRVSHEFRILHPDGKERWLQNHLLPFMNESDQLVRLDGLVVDITERRLAELSKQHSEFKFQALFQHSNDMIFLFRLSSDAPPQLLEVNDAGCEKLGYTRTEIMGARPLDLIDAKYHEHVQRSVEELARRGRAFAEVEYTTRNGSRIPVILSARVFDLGGDKAGLVICRDITERKRNEARMHHAAFHDELTNLPNRRTFRDILTAELERTLETGMKCAVMLLDLDRFKDINDSLGHTFGDEVLGQVAVRLKNIVTETDIIARMGGDEFAVLLTGLLSPRRAEQVALAMVEAMRRPVSVGDYEFQVTTSIGIAVSPSDGEDAQTLLKNADSAMYAAKEQGNCHRLYEENMGQEGYQRLMLGERLRRAILQGELVLHYQPIVDVANKRAVAVEALVRWNHPERGMVPPSEFIPVAERTGYIRQLGEWVLRTACNQNKAWQNAGYPPIRVAVNVSARQLVGQDLVKLVEDALQQANLAPEWLEIEITESAILQDMDYAVSVFQTLKSMGVHISIDDFGTGYSSLNYLTRLKIDALKIDQSFIQNMSTDAENEAITSAVITLASSLKLGVVAEGVETEAQLHLLHRKQCHQMQGYLFSRPVPANQVEHLLGNPGIISEQVAASIETLETT